VRAAGDAAGDAVGEAAGRGAATVADRVDGGDGGVAPAQADNVQAIANTNMKIFAFMVNPLLHGARAYGLRCVPLSHLST
jgi:hypothetical protein